MAKAKIKLSSRGIAELLRSPGVEAHLMSLAEPVAAAARARAPVDSGAYRDSIAVESVQHPSRVVARVVARSEHGVLVEAKTGNLARALDFFR